MVGEKKRRGGRDCPFSSPAWEIVSPYLFLAAFLAVFFAGFFADFLALFLALFLAVFFTATLIPSLSSHRIKIV